ncbi:MAG: 6-phosphogluconolactonase [Asticcacaulis sp.]|nr:6-phosphogluconolactonase [Asticcacaulis sp.]
MPHFFPNRPEITDADLFAATVPETLPHKHVRLTLGRRAFAQCDLLTLVVAGAGKRAMLEACLSINADPQALPAALIAEQGHAIAFTD